MKKSSVSSIPLLLLCVPMVSCPGPLSTSSPTAAPSRVGTSSDAVGVHLVATEDLGLTMKLGEGVDGAGNRQPTPPAKSTPLSDADTANVLRRLAPLKTEATDQKDFALREKSLPAPRTGKTIKDAFPPPEAPPIPDKAEAGPLEVLRHMPEGAVPLAPHVSLTFSQPMVAVTSYAELEKLPVPAQLVPQPPGRWRWVGAKTLLFEAKGELERLPMATDFTVTIPAGTHSATGGTLAKAASWTFSTPTLQLQQFYPEGGIPTRRDSVIFASFDQKIDAAAVVKTIRLETGGQPFAARLATAEEIRTDATVSRFIAALDADGRKDRYLAFRATELLPVDSYVNVIIGPGTPSAEGPKKTEARIERGFKTYGPMAVTNSSCRKEYPCPPMSQLWVQFSNPIQTKQFTKDMVSIEPALPGLKVVARGNGLVVSGRTKGRSQYTVTYSDKIPDTFGQTHFKEEKVTFYTGAAGQGLFAMGGNFVVLDPHAGAKFSVYSINQPKLKVKAFAQSPEGWKDYARFMREVWNREQYPPDPPGRKVMDELVAVKGEPDELTETAIDLSKAVPSGSGNVVLVVEPPVRPKNRWEWAPVILWIQITPIGLDAIVDHEKLIGWATNLADGKPLAGVELTIQPTGVTAKTDGTGTAQLPLGSPPGEQLVAKWNGQVAFLPDSTGYWDSASWSPYAPGAGYHWYVADDRQMYKPDEEVKIKGWIRRIGGGPTGDVMPWAQDATKVSYSLADSRGNEVLKGETAINALGGFDASFKLPATMNLGYANLRLRAEGASETSHSIRVQEFRRPEFEVQTEASEGPHYVGGRATVGVTAKYYAGGGLANAETTWNVTAIPGQFTPPNRDDFVFGREVSWFDSYFSSGDAGTLKANQFSAHTDSSGKHLLRLDFLAVNPPQPTNVNAQATVMDVNRQAWTATANLLVHPADLYVGLRVARPFVQRGEPLKVESIVTDLDGKGVAGRNVHLHAARVDWDYEDDEYKTKEADVKECDVTSTDKAELCTLATGEGGMYRITATITDDKGRANMARLSVWVAGGKLPPQRGVALEPVRLLPDKKEYRGGDTAEILVVPPWSPAEGIFTLRRNGLLRTERFTISGASHTLKVKIDDGWTPNVLVNVDLVGAAPRTNDSGDVDETLGKRPAVASGSISLPVPPVARKLALTVTPRDAKLEPGGETTVEVDLKDAKGEPVIGGEVAVVIVDEAVLSLTGYRLPDPLPFFYPGRGEGARDYHLRTSILLARPAELQTQAEGMRSRGDAFGVSFSGVVSPSVAMPSPAPPPAESAAEEKLADQPGGGSSGQQPIKIRTDFNALAVFAPAVTTDANGHASVPVKLPDNLTRYRVMAVAVSGARQFGAGESTITARLPLMVRPSPPRFLNFGDTFEMPVVLQNQTDLPLDVDVAMRTSNAELIAGAGRRVVVPANDRVEVRFPTAANRAGIARFQFAAIATRNGRWADAAELALPVWTPATTEAFATYGTIDGRGAEAIVAQPVQMPENVFPQFGGVEISTSSTAVQALTDAVLYLVRYPYECSEQMASRVLAIASLRDVLTAFKADGLPTPEAMLASVKKDVELLRRLQNYDGGWGFWKHGEESWPFLTLHVTHVLARAKAKGFEIPQRTLDAALPYLRDIESHISPYYSRETRQALIAYSLYVRQLLGDRDLVKTQRLVAEAGGVEKLPLEAVGWIYPVVSGGQGVEPIVAAIRKLLANRVEETAGAAHFTTSYGDGNYLLLASDRRVDALFLEGLIIDQPKSDVIPKLVEGLLGHRRAGHWANTQEDGWVLLALDKYFNTYEKITPDFVAKAWLGSQFAGEHAFRGRTTDRHAIDIPMAWLAEKGKGTQSLVLQKDGAGRLYYRIGMSYAPTSLVMPPRDNGFTVERAYESVDGKSDVERSQDGSWRIKAGARVRVRITMVAPARRYHVALVDPIPAGLEPLNPALATTGAIPKDPKDQRAGAWWWGAWYEHQNMRDERVEAFASLLWEGVYTYTYVARATTPGRFVVPPPKAEEMYHPETFGRGSGDRVIIE